MKLIVQILLFLLIKSSLFAQMSFSPNLSTDTMAKRLIGPGVTLDSVLSFNPTNQIAYFKYYGIPRPVFEEGLMFSTGICDSLLGGNYSDGSSTDFQRDPIHDIFWGSNSGNAFDLASISLKVTPHADTLFIHFMFGSEEYIEWSNSNFGDYPGIFAYPFNAIQAEITNSARVPNSNLVVSVGTINETENSQYFSSNGVNDGQFKSTFALDGITSPLIAKIPVIPEQSYLLKIGICDIFDGAFDSALFLRKAGITTIPLVSVQENSFLSNFMAIMKEDNLLVNYSLPNSGSLNLTILNEFGQIVFSNFLVGNQGNNHHSFNTSLTSGFYFCRFDFNGYQKVVKFIKP